MKERLLRDLGYIKTLIQDMDLLNREKRALIKQKKPLIQMMEPIAAPTKRKTNPVIFVFIGLLLFALVITTGRFHSRALQDYENAAFNDEFAWKLNHMENNEPYPGYDGEKPTLASSLMSTILYALPETAAISAVVGVGFILWNGVQKRKREYQNKQIEAHNQMAVTENNRIMRHNEDVETKISNCNARQKTISTAYQKNAQEWFIDDYAFPAAVDFFIDRVRKNRLPSLNSHKETYEEYRTIVLNEAAQSFEQYLRDMKEDQRHTELMNAQQQLIQLQMIGNWISAANLFTNMARHDLESDMANSLGNIERKLYS